MLFYSVPFIVFFCVFFFLYWVVFPQNLKLQNILLLAGCYTFYGWWDWRFLLLIIAYSLLNFFIGLSIAKSPGYNTKRYLSIIATIISIGLLAYFKYLNFFAGQLVTALSSFNMHLDVHLVEILMPLGISFYTFRTLGYIYDVKNGKIEACSNSVVFLSFVAFFPSLLSGPIDSARKLIPQIEKKRIFNYDNAADGLRQILWGLFKKIVIAGNLEPITAHVFHEYQNLSGSILLLGSWYYTIQLYVDFSSYSDMAIGFARLLGFEVTQNFNYPLFSRNVTEYWRKWHMSLTGWFTEYVFTPLSFSLRYYGKAGLIIAIILNFLLVGIWHGANWTFLVFGLINGLYFIPGILKGRKSKRVKGTKASKPHYIYNVFCVIRTFMLISFAQIFFRSNDLNTAIQYIKRIFSTSLLYTPLGFRVKYIPFIALFFLVEWLQRDKRYALQIENIGNPFLRSCIYYSLLLAMVFLGSPQVAQFIYLKF